jgi:hypothetical protein
VRLFVKKRVRMSAGDPRRTKEQRKAIYRSNTFVTVLELDGETDRVSDTVSAPAGSDAGLDGWKEEQTESASGKLTEKSSCKGRGWDEAHLDRPQALAVGVSTFEAGGDELRPDVGQVLSLSSEEIEPLTAGDLEVEVVLLGDPPDGHDA